MQILFPVSELYPYVKTGGLADVAEALPKALTALGHDPRLLIPAYPAVKAAITSVRAVFDDADLFGGGPARLWLAALEGLPMPAYLLDSDGLFERPGGPYQRPGGGDWPDNPRRFAALSWAAARIGWDGADGWRPDVIHGHDWQTGLMPAYLAAFQRSDPHRRRPGTVLTIHNLAYQGQFAPSVFGELGLPADFAGLYGVEYYGGVGFLKAGLLMADRVTTVSPTYADEIRRPETGFGLDGLLRGRRGRVSGIVNGVDTSVWNPADDPFLPARYDATDLAGKAVCKAQLQAEMDLTPDAHAPLFGAVARLTYHKGLDLLLGATAGLVAGGGQLVLLGSGEPALEAGFRDLAAAYPGRVAVRIGYDEGLSHRIQAGADSILVPSRSEPCGLTQLYALRYGSPPLVRRTGGLADTVVNAEPWAVAEGVATGFQFDDATPGALAGTLAWAMERYRDGVTWPRLQATGMAIDVGWGASAEAYLTLYDRAISDAAGFV